jgi:hypothetical protein
VTASRVRVTGGARGNEGGMTAEHQTRFTYRLLDADGRTTGERELPTDGEALTWAEEVRAEESGLGVLRVERETEQGWVPVEEGGTLAAERGSEDL